MSLTVRSFRVPKRGNSVEECEDACAADEATGRIAVADGATESIYASFWAELLVEHFVNHASGPADAEFDWLSNAQARWREHFEGRSMQYYVAEKIREGSFSALLGLVLKPAEAAGLFRWSALAIGDTCLFHTRGSELLSAFPLTHAEQFNNAPVLLGSRTLPDGVATMGAVTANGSGERNDRIWLMTDALAHWFLQEMQCHRNPLTELETFASEPNDGPDFGEWIEKLRDDKRLRNDDATLVAVVL